jgi:hypothetical protein
VQLPFGVRLAGPVQELGHAQRCLERDTRADGALQHRQRYRRLGERRVIDPFDQLAQAMRSVVGDVMRDDDYCVMR